MAFLLPRRAVSSANEMISFASAMMAFAGGAKIKTE